MNVYSWTPYINGNPILHIVDEGNHFSAAQFLPAVSTDSVWQALLKCWGAIYTGLPNRALLDQGSHFRQLFIDLAKIHYIKVENTGIQAHSILGLGERYHQPLHQPFRKIMAEDKKTDLDLALALSFKEMNDTLGPEGLVPSALVFGEFPKIQGSKPTPRATLLSCRAVAETAGKEMEKHIAKMKINRALNHMLPKAANISYQTGDNLLVWSEKVADSRIGEWLGPLSVYYFEPEKKLVLVQDDKCGSTKPFNIVQVKPYLQQTDVAHSFMPDLHRALYYNCTPEDNDIYLTEIIDRQYPRADSLDMTEAKKTEIRNLPERGTFKVILKQDIPSDANILPVRFVLAIKSTEDGEVKFKARYVIGGHRDNKKNLMFHTATTLQPQSIRLPIALSSMNDFDIWTSDVRQAYLQSSEPLQRDIFIRKPVAEFELESYEFLELLKPQYGLCESGDLWHKTLDEHHCKDLKMTDFRFDPALYHLKQDGHLVGLSGGYVDDPIRGGNKEFRNHTDKTEERFDMDEDKRIPCSFTGFSLSRGKNGTIIQDQHGYRHKVEHIPADSSFKLFRSMRVKRAWLSQTRPDCVYEISELSKVTEDRFEKFKREEIKRLNRAIQYAIDNRVSLKIPQLDLESLRVVGVSDSSFESNFDLSSQLRHITFLCDKHDHAVPVHFKPYKSTRVTRSPMAGEVIAFSDILEHCITLAEELRHLFNRKIPIQLFTDSHSLFDVIPKGSLTSAKRTIIDIAAAREVFKDHLISYIGFVRSFSNIADGVTKAMSQAALQDVLRTGKYCVRAEQWIVRN